MQSKSQIVLGRPRSGSITSKWAKQSAAHFTLLHRLFAFNSATSLLKEAMARLWFQATRRGASNQAAPSTTCVCNNPAKLQKSHLHHDITSIRSQKYVHNIYAREGQQQLHHNRGPWLA